MAFFGFYVGIAYQNYYDILDYGLAKFVVSRQY